MKGIDTEAFVRQQQIASHLHEQSILGYRGLVGKIAFRCAKFEIAKNHTHTHTNTQEMGNHQTFFSFSLSRSVCLYSPFR